MFVRRIIDFLSGAFRPPFYGLSFLVWGFIVWAFMLHPDTTVFAEQLNDSDDFVHLIRAIDWLKGQDWFDPHLYRLAPPEGVVIHYSRLSELPLAAFIWPLHASGLSWSLSGMIVAAFWPLVLIFAFFAALRWAADSVMSKDWSRITAYILLFAPPVLFQFAPGRVDHHGLALILTTLAMGCVLRLMQEPQKVIWGLGGGLFLALGQGIAMETLPWLLLLSGWVGLWVMIKGRGPAISAFVFGLSLYVFSALVLSITVAPTSFYELNPLVYSYLYVLMAGGIALGLAGIALAAHCSHPAIRYVTGVTLAAVLGFVFFKHFPQLVAGPYGGMDPDLAQMMFNNISEALPLTRRAGSFGAMVGTLIFSVLGLVACIGFALRGEKRLRWLWVPQALLLSVAVGLTLFYQVRILTYAELFAILPMAAFLPVGLKFVREKWRGRKQVAMEALILLLVGPLPSLLVPAALDGRSLNPGVLLFPVSKMADKNCHPSAVWQMLSLESYYGNRPRVVMNTIGDGAEIMYFTPHSAIAAPYHTNVRGNLDSLHFFTTTDPAEAEKIARTNQAELVLICAVLPDFYRHYEEGPIVIMQDGKKAPDEGEFFAQKLIKGNPPSWLKQIEMPFMGNMMLFEVLPKDAAKTNSKQSAKSKKKP